MLIFIIFIISILLMSAIAFFIFFNKKNKKKKLIKVIKIIQESKPIKQPAFVITSQDIKAIAGEDMIATQLDLARAYIEIDKKKLAKKILEHVAQNGNSGQQLAAYQLMTNL